MKCPVELTKNGFNFRRINLKSISATLAIAEPLEFGYHSCSNSKHPSPSFNESVFIYFVYLVGYSWNIQNTNRLTKLSMPKQISQMKICTITWEMISFGLKLLFSLSCWFAFAREKWIVNSEMNNHEKWVEPDFWLNHLNQNQRFRFCLCPE